VAFSPRLEKLFDIIFEDADLLVVNKPAGLVCHPTKNGEMSSLIGRARLYLESSSRRESAHSSKLEKSQSKLTFAAAPHLVNRLDRETSGVVIIAKNSAAAGELGKILESRAIEKEYLAIVHGHVRENSGLIDALLGKDEHSIVAVKDCVRPDGAPSQTEFFVERRFQKTVSREERDVREGIPEKIDPSPPSRPSRDIPELKTQNSKLKIERQPFTLLRIFPRTGRKHQIRIHLAHIGHPVVGDKLYGGDEDIYMALVQNRLTDAQRAKLIFENQALHARSLKFLRRGRPVEFSCEPGPWFTDFFNAKAQSF
jgi:23S rRNA pseudouridine1911/1915/1917 synthase